MTSDTLKLDGGTSPTRERTKAILEGELENMQVPTLLQSINMSKMTGRLNISNESSKCDVYFSDGAPQHAEAPENKGDAAIVEILTWEHGQFRFYQGEQSTEKSIKRRLDGLSWKVSRCSTKPNFWTAPASSKTQSCCGSTSASLMSK